MAECALLDYNPIGRDLRPGGVQNSGLRHRIGPPTLPDRRAQIYDKRHLGASPECACGAHWEDRRHFLLDCPLYQQQRRALIRSLKCKSLSLTHLGDLRSTLAIIEFINSTDRFPTYYARVSEEATTALKGKGSSTPSP